MTRLFIILFFAYVLTALAQVMGPKVGVQQLEYDFGNINQGDVVNHLFLISNNGGDILKILDVRASCGCTAANPDKNELKPGESTNINVTFNSKGRKGPQTKSVTVSTNDPDKPSLVLNIKCNIIVNEVLTNKIGANIFFPKTEHDFGKVKEGLKVEYTFKFKNNGTGPLVIKDIKTSCGCTAAVVSDKTISPGQEGSINVNFDTKNRSGRNSKSITVVSNDTKEPNKVITIYADVQKN